MILLQACSSDSKLLWWTDNKYKSNREFGDFAEDITLVKHDDLIIILPQFLRNCVDQMLCSLPFPLKIRLRIAASLTPPWASLF